jgi:hypothetical protein
VDFPWEEAVAGGASVLFLCSAPSSAAGGTFWLRDWMTKRERWVLCLAELRSAKAVTTPRELPELLDRIAAGDPPGPDDELGV